MYTGRISPASHTKRPIKSASWLSSTLSQSGLDLSRSVDI